MKRRRATILTILSAVLLAGAAGMWVRSLFWQDQVGIAIADVRLWLGSSSQQIWLKGSASFSSTPIVEANLGHGRADRARLEQLLPAYQKGIWTRAIGIPYWLIVLPASILPLRFVLSARPPGRRRMRVKRGGRR